MNTESGIAHVCFQGLLLPPRHHPHPLAFTIYSLTSTRLCTSESSFSCPSPSALPTRVQCYCNTIAQCTIPLQPPLCMPYTMLNWYWQYPVRANPTPLVVKMPFSPVPNRVKLVNPPPLEVEKLPPPLGGAVFQPRGLLY